MKQLFNQTMPKRDASATGSQPPPGEHRPSPVPMTTLPMRDLLALCLLAIGLAACDLAPVSANSCSNQLLAQSPSPDQQSRIVLFSRDCGATTATALHISLLAQTKSVDNASGNLWVAEPQGWTQADVQIEWQSPSQLEIRYPKQALLFKQETQLQGVTVRYRAE